MQLNENVQDSVPQHRQPSADAAADLRAAIAALRTAVWVLVKGPRGEYRIVGPPWAARGMDVLRQ